MADEPVLVAVEQCKPGAPRPKELFNDLIEELEMEYERAKVGARGGDASVGLRRGWGAGS
jgi:hypothetical protein